MPATHAANTDQADADGLVDVQKPAGGGRVRVGAHSVTASRGDLRRSGSNSREGGASSGTTKEIAPADLAGIV
ncbi:MAG: hypothetical protein AMXMBFR82_46000 [Candidatus Hydrogenedentota bacterium]